MWSLFSLIPVPQIIWKGRGIPMLGLMSMMWAPMKIFSKFLDPKHGFGLFQSVPRMETASPGTRIKKTHDPKQFHFAHKKPHPHKKYIPPPRQIQKILSYTMQKQKKPVFQKSSGNTIIPNDINRDRDPQRLIKVKSQQNLLISKATITQARFEQQLIKDIQELKDIIGRYSVELDSKGVFSVVSSDRSGVEKYCRCIDDLEKTIQAKNQEIQEINQEIKVLRTHPSEPGKDRHIRRSHQFHRLSEEIKDQRDELLALQKEHQIKKKQLTQNRKVLKQTIDTFSVMMQSQFKKLPTYQQFLMRKKQKPRTPKQQSNPKYRSSKKGIKQGQESGDQNKNILHSTNLTDAENRRKVAEYALRIGKKKHQAQINQMNLKLEFLRGQDMQMDAKLIQKEAELRKAQEKFSKAKQNLMGGQLKGPKIARYSQPEL